MHLIYCIQHEKNDCLELAKHLILKFENDQPDRADNRHTLQLGIPGQIVWHRSRAGKNPSFIKKKKWVYWVLLNF